MKAASWSVALLFAISGTAYDASQDSCIEGFVTFRNTAYLAGVRIGVHSLAKDLYLEAETNASGYYAFAALPPGGYGMWADAKDYGCILIPRVPVHYGERVRQDFNFSGRIPRGGCDAIEKASHSRTKVK
jgi:hypothetical protein